MRVSLQPPAGPVDIPEMEAGDLGDELEGARGAAGADERSVLRDTFGTLARVLGLDVSIRDRVLRVLDTDYGTFIVTWLDEHPSWVGMAAIGAALLDGGKAKEKSSGLEGSQDDGRPPGGGGADGRVLDGQGARGRWQATQAVVAEK